MKPGEHGEVHHRRMRAFATLHALLGEVTAGALAQATGDKQKSLNDWLADAVERGALARVTSKAGFPKHGRYTYPSSPNALREPGERPAGGART